ncbi:MAG: DUF2786 domain-containing protein [Planctomycetota bacterium]
MSDLQRIKDRIRQCLAVAANDASAQAEIEQAVRVARSLMHKHNLERDDVEERDDGTIDVSRVSYGRYTASGGTRSVQAFESVLSKAVCDLYPAVSVYIDHQKAPQKVDGVKTVNRNGEWKMTTQFRFFGPDEEARAAAETFELMRVEIVAMAITKYGGWARGDGRSYCWGFAEGFREAHAKETKAIESYDNQSRGLIAMSEKRQLAIRDASKDWLSESMGVKLFKRKGSRTSARSNAFEDGKRDGRRTDRPAQKTAAARIA